MYISISNQNDEKFGTSCVASCPQVLLVCRLYEQLWELSVYNKLMRVVVTQPLVSCQGHLADVTHTWHGLAALEHVSDRKRKVATRHNCTLILGRNCSFIKRMTKLTQAQAHTHTHTYTPAIWH